MAQAIQIGVTRVRSFDQPPRGCVTRTRTFQVSREIPLVLLEVPQQSAEGDALCRHLGPGLTVVLSDQAKPHTNEDDE